MKEITNSHLIQNVLLLRGGKEKEEIKRESERQKQCEREGKVRGGERESPLKIDFFNFKSMTTFSDNGYIHMLYMYNLFFIMDIYSN